MSSIRKITKEGNLVQLWNDATKSTFFTDIKHIEGNRFLVLYRTGTVAPLASYIWLIECVPESAVITCIASIYSLGNAYNPCGVTMTTDGNHIICLYNSTTPSEVDTIRIIDWNGSLIASADISSIVTGAMYIDCDDEFIYVSATNNDIYVFDISDYSLVRTIVYGAGYTGIHLEDDQIWRAWFNSVGGTTNVSLTDMSGNIMSNTQLDAGQLVGWNGITGDGNHLYICK